MTLSCVSDISTQLRKQISYDTLLYHRCRFLLPTLLICSSDYYDLELKGKKKLLNYLAICKIKCQPDRTFTIS